MTINPLHCVEDTYPFRINVNPHSNFIDLSDFDDNLNAEKQMLTTTNVNSSLPEKYFLDVSLHHQEIYVMIPSPPNVNVHDSDIPEKLLLPDDDRNAFVKHIFDFHTNISLTAYF